MIESMQTMIETFFRGLGITIEDLSVSVEDAERHIFAVKLKTSDSARIIGVHGHTLEAVQHLLGRMTESITGTTCRLHIEVNDYISTKEEKLYRFIDRKIDQVRKTGEDTLLPDLTSYQRKKVHDYISTKNITGLRSFSMGEGRERKLCISLSAPPIDTTLAIEEDGIGI